MKKLKTLITISVTLILTLAFIQNTIAQNSGEMQTFFSEEYAGISIKFNASRKTVPGENITIDLWINCTAAGVNIDSLTLDVYGFKYGQEKTQLYSAHVIENRPLVLNNISQFNYTVHVPHDVWDATYADIHLQYSIRGSFFEYSPNFLITVVRNVYLEELENKFESLNHTYWQLNETFWKSFQMNLTEENLVDLNQTYQELQQNYTSFRGSLGELESTRQAVIILAITTVCFVATTLYVVMRKPKQNW